MIYKHYINLNQGQKKTPQRVLFNLGIEPIIRLHQL